MRLGLQIVRFNWPGSPENTGVKLAEIAREAEAADFYSLGVMDHYYQIAPGLGPVDSPMLEGYSALHDLASMTQRIKLGPLVSGVIYRQPLSRPHPPNLIGGMGEKKTLRLVAQYADACPYSLGSATSS